MQTLGIKKKEGKRKRKSKKREKSVDEIMINFILAQRLCLGDRVSESVEGVLVFYLIVDLPWLFLYSIQIFL